MASDLNKRLTDEIDKIPAIDIHSRVRSDEPSTSTAAEVIFHPEIKTLLIAAGVSSEAFEEDVSSADRLKKCLPHFPRIKNTAVFWRLDHLLRDLYGVESIDESCATNQGQSPKETLERANVERVVGVVNWWKGVEQAEDLPVVPGLQLDSLINQPHLSRTMDRLGEASGESIYEAGDLRKAVIRLIANAADSGCRALSASFNPKVTFERGSREAADRVLSLVMLGQKTSPDDRKSLRSFVMSSVLEAAAENELTFQLMLGTIESAPGETALPAFEPELLRSFLDVFEQYPSVNFDLYLANTVQSQELAALAAKVRNVYASGYPASVSHSMQVSKMLRERIEMLPMTRSCAFSSQAPNVEWIYGEAKMLRHILALTLTAMIEEGLLSEEIALDLARYYLRENAMRLYFGPWTPRL